MFCAPYICILVSSFYNLHLTASIAYTGGDTLMADTQAMRQLNRGSMAVFDQDTCIGRNFLNPMYQSYDMHINNATAVVVEESMQFDKYLDKQIILDQQGCSRCKKLVFAILILVCFKDLPSVLLTSCYLT